MNGSEDTEVAAHILKPPSPSVQMAGRGSVPNFNAKARKPQPLVVEFLSSSCLGGH